MRRIIIGLLFKNRTGRNGLAGHFGQLTTPMGFQSARRFGCEWRHYDIGWPVRSAGLRSTGHPLVSGHDRPPDVALHCFATGTWPASSQFRYQRQSKFDRLLSIFDLIALP